mmetsp:Transcript_21179/g.65127  ORF Transcript_21179/g.65127 Transcript_21179/m.65127 type:complete len:249 (-) Transcript_21179:54-800(-)
MEHADVIPLAYKFGGLLVVLHVAGLAVTGSHIAAHVVPQFVGFLAFAYMGVMAWTDGMHGRLGIASDVYAAAPAFGVAACTFQIPFQLYELACAALVKRLRGKSFEMVIHHALSLTLASMAVNKGMYFFYGTYFFGLSEFSSIPLAFVDLFKMFPDLKKKYAAANEAVRPFFAVIFLVVRSVYWPLVSYHFWVASLAHWPSDALEVTTFCVVNVLLTGLQGYWTYLILIGLYKIATGDPTSHDVDKID